MWGMLSPMDLYEDVCMDSPPGFENKFGWNVCKIPIATLCTQTIYTGLVWKVDPISKRKRVHYTQGQQTVAYS